MRSRREEGKVGEDKRIIREEKITGRKVEERGEEDEKNASEKIKEVEEKEGGNKKVEKRGSEKERKSASRNSSVPKQTGEKAKKHSLSSLTGITQEEVKALFIKAKRSMTPHKDKKKKVEIQKRSRSTPNERTESVTAESFEKIPIKQRKLSFPASSSEDEGEKRKKLYRPIVQEFVRKKKQTRYGQSEKIIQVIDPRTSRILTTRSTSKLRFNLIGFIKALGYFKIGDFSREYRAFRLDMKAECDKIRILRNRCACELLLIMIMCGLGGIVFKTTEGAFENFYKCGVKRVKRDFLDVLWTRSHNMREEEWKSLARNKLRHFEDELHAAHEAGIHTYSGQRSWSFFNGIVYCLTVITTIGTRISCKLFSSGNCPNFALKNF